MHGAGFVPELHPYSVDVCGTRMGPKSPSISFSTGRSITNPAKQPQPVPGTCYIAISQSVVDALNLHRRLAKWFCIVERLLAALITGHGLPEELSTSKVTQDASSTRGSTDSKRRVLLRRLSSSNGTLTRELSPATAIYSLDRESVRP